MTRPPSLRLAALVLALSLAGAACLTTDVAGPSTGGPIVTDSLVYHARSVAGDLELSIGFTYVNRTGARVYLPSCQGVHPPDLEWWSGSEWVVVHSPLILLCLGPPEVVAHGDSFRSVFRLSSGIRPGAEPTEGRFRLAWRIYRTWLSDGGPGEVLRLDQRVSNEFRIVR